MSIELLDSMKNILLKLGAFYLIDTQGTANSHEFQGVLLEFRSIFRRLEQVQPIVKKCSKPNAAGDGMLGIGQDNGVATQILWSVHGRIFQKQLAIEF